MRRQTYPVNTMQRSQSAFPQYANYNPMPMQYWREWPSTLPYRSAELGPSAAGLGVTPAGVYHHHHQRTVPQQTYQHIPHRGLPFSTLNTHPTFLPTMAYQQSEEDLAEFQNLSNSYEPEATGPLVGTRQSTDAITAEYAAADPVYQAKTAVLPRTYAFYRTMRGDGRCGWRAMAFGYFESLVRLGDKTKFMQEEVRLKSLRNVCVASGLDMSILQDFEEETIDLLKSTAGTINTADAEASLVNVFTNEEIQNSLITYFRVLCAAWIKTRPEEFAGFIAPMTIEDFCSQSVMAHASEITEVSLNALNEVLLKPAGIALEIVYLDRSTGPEANTYCFSPLVRSVPVRMLYRPGHYDLLYKAGEEIPSPAPAQPTQPITAQTFFARPNEVSFFEQGMPDLVSRIPGMSFVNYNQTWPSTNDFQDFDIGTSIMPPQIQEIPCMIPATPSCVLTKAEDYAPQDTFEADPNFGLAPRPPPSTDFDPRGMFRASKLMWDLRVANPFPAADAEFRTAPFKNSQYNKSHYMNQDFEPEHWNPDDEYITVSNKNKRNKQP